MMGKLTVLTDIVFVDRWETPFPTEQTKHEVLTKLEALTLSPVGTTVDFDLLFPDPIKDCFYKRLQPGECYLMMDNEGSLWIPKGGRHPNNYYKTLTRKVRLRTALFPIKNFS